MPVIVKDLNYGTDGIAHFSKYLRIFQLAAILDVKI